MTIIVERIGPEPIHRLMDFVGFIPMWLDVTDMRPAAVQFNEHYQHGGGWRPFGQNEWRIVRENCLKYPGDPQLVPLARIKFRDEEIYIYYHGLVMIKQPDGKFEVCRMD
jgi:hypothetical protein